ncbi:hypothetical protein QH639_19575 [Lysinibacillus sp. 1 U-2021]|uniref:hypothetical protein n=1 Tax=Lysinibacillus sp. 1 U-2021 TaxID=3039426 RepID=UPI002480C821|nr:hypothetical protein [Lysinibacillus sp. 1 U-2021]WGT38003.1 hypothetical protein QH639_19575 [Lysinibacillus sp. 1 U-2021]
MSFLGFEDGCVFETFNSHQNYHSINVNFGLIDQLLIDGDLNTSDTIEKTNNFTYDTVINGNLQNNLEFGSLNNNGVEISKLRFQKRKVDEQFWVDVSELNYEINTKKYYETVDKYVANDFEYEYSLIPIANEVTGNRIISNRIKVDFDGYFISDKDNNYRIFYGAQMGNIEHVSPSTVFEPLNSKYPVVSYGQLDYRKASLSGTILSSSTIKNDFPDIKSQKLEKQQLLYFLKSKRPKVFRGMDGEIMLIQITDNPVEETNNDAIGIANVSFSFIEIGDMESNTLKINGMLEGLDES